MQVDEDMVRRVASVARLDLTEEELKQFVPQLKDIIEAFSKLDEVDVKGVRSSFQPISIEPNLREDKAEICLTQEEALSNTDHKKDGYFKGPKVV